MSTDKFDRFYKPQDSMEVSSCRCVRCNRVLTDQASIDRKMGRICYARVQAKHSEHNDSQSLLSLEDHPLDEYVICEREGDWTLRTNVPRLIVKHSPTGYEWGYAGSGCADFALNIVEYYVRVIEQDAELNLGDHIAGYEYGYYHESTGHLYHEFKREFIATMPRAGGKIDANEIITWITRRIHERRSVWGWSE